MLRREYPKFFDLFCYQVIRVGNPDTNLLKARLTDFITNTEIDSLYGQVNVRYNEIAAIESDLNQAFELYRHYFPSKIQPQLLTFISGFVHSIVCADSVLGIGLDMYLGKESPYYQALQFPQYKIIHMTSDYMTADALRGWLETEWILPDNHTDLVSQMIYKGKILVALQKLFPEKNDSILTGYSNAQLEWCSKSEKNIWSFFIDHKLLFSNEQNHIMKYLSEGPTTNGFPKESPANIGQWIGYKIVSAYMQQHPEVTLNDLLNDTDYKKILNESGYKPGK
jgi:hypothetical protein